MLNNEKLPTHKLLAKQAKKRLVSGYWQQVQKERKLFIEEESIKNKNCNISSLNEIYKRKIEREIQKINEKDPDEKLYAKVCKLLSQNEFVLNPIAQLIDHSVYDELDLHAKQIYISKLTDKYNTLKERYNNEVRNKIAVN